MERDAELIGLIDGETGTETRCLNCVEKVSIPLWLPRNVLDFLDRLCGNYGESECELMLLQSVKANLSELTGVSATASALTRQLNRIVDDITSQ
ncbi:MAG TPA: hypothetical protein VM050_08995 [Patescibacteria group bacterium]|nr:hypothetical protein [Patescibacteria group bacterium]